MIYLASPYTHPDPRVREQRFDAACHAVAGLIRSGQPAYSPIVHGHPLVQLGLPIEWDWWEPHGRSFLARCDELAVLTLDGWRESVGVTVEIAVAQELWKPVRYLAVDLYSPTLARVAMEVRP